MEKVDLNRTPCDFDRCRVPVGTCDCDICGWHRGEAACPNDRPRSAAYRM